MEKKQAMWMYPKLHGFNPPERWGRSACYSHGSLYIFGAVEKCWGRRRTFCCSISGSNRVLWRLTFQRRASARPANNVMDRHGNQRTSESFLNSYVVLVIGGVGDKHYYNDVWVLDMASSCSWTRLDVCGHHQPQGRFSHTAVVTPFDIVIYGGCGEDERPLNELLLLHLGTPRKDLYTNNLGHNIIQQKPFWMRSADTKNPKRKRMMNSNASARCWEVVESSSQQEEHSLSLSQHSFPSQSDKKQQASTKKRGASDSLASLFKQLNPPPTRIHHHPTNTNDVTSSTRNMMEIAIPYNAAEQQFRRKQAMMLSPLDQQQQKPTEQQNLIGAEVRGKVDGLFDSGLLMTANVNGRILSGVLFPAAPMVGNGAAGGWLSPSSSTTAPRSEFSTRTTTNQQNRTSSTLHRLPSSSVLEFILKTDDYMYTNKQRIKS